jgi:hypothetical protein
MRATFLFLLARWGFSGFDSLLRMQDGGCAVYFRVEWKDRFAKYDLNFYFYASKHSK